ncbi:MAG TPA: glycosyltransferase family 39 protein [Thermoanaerobaculia bacterium]|jgi:4-amino-4-deoxy-L-arabinose transferase-like glycosyltransferase
MSRIAYIAAIAALTLLAVLRAAAPHEEYAATLDEPIHLAAGFEWYDGHYTTDLTHPPLARIVCALPLRLAGLPSPKPANMVDRGNQLLYHRGVELYEETLASARRGNLLFLILGVVVVALWARRLFSRAVAVTAVALYTAHPLILGHAGLVTTDMAVAATLPLALFALELFLERPSWRRTLFLGIAVGVGSLSKFTFFVYFPPCALLLVLLRRKLPVKQTAAAIAIALLVVWGGYRFHFAKVTDPNTIVFAAPKPLQPLATRIAQLRLPAPELIEGIAQVKLHDKLGHGGYLFGREYTNGWWPYFAVLLFYKSPIPWLIFAAWGAALLWRKPVLVLLPVVILLVASTSTINIGVRHILPLFALLSIVAAYAVVDVWGKARDAFSRVAVVALLVWLAGGVAAAHPDYLPWFNEAAQPTPSRITVDSNLDWGQDVLRLAKVVRDRRIEHLHVAFFTPVRIGGHGINATGLTPHVPVQGWVAISEHQIRFAEDSGDYAWLSAYRPVQMVGESIRLYHIP